MRFAKGTPRPENSGRKKGQGNKATARAILQALGCDPIEGMARIAMDPKTKRELAGRMYAELAQYCWPKLKAVDHTFGGADALSLNVSGTELLASRIASLAAKIGVAGGDSKPD